MTEPSFFDKLRLYLPQYLSPERRDALWEDLRTFPHNKSIYSDSNEDPEPLQGDAWRGFVAIDFYSSQRKTVSGLVLSNSCDISETNSKTLSSSIAFAPMLRVANYVDRLKAAGKREPQCESILSTIRRQKVTNLFHLPAHGEHFPESIARLDDIQSHPIDDFQKRDRTRLVRLSDFGFYLFLFKLSIHFTRMQEAVQR